MKYYSKKLLLGGTSLMLLLSVLSACGSKTESNATSSGDASWQEDRVAALEKKLNEQTGKLDEQNTKIAELEKKLDELSANVVAANQAGGGTSTNEPGNNGSAGKGDGVRITFAQYEKLEVGMTVDEVVEILGGEGEALSEAENMVVYSYKGAVDNGGNAVLAFQGGKLLTKAQSGLE